MASQLDRIEEKVDRVSQRQDRIDVTLAKQHVSLDEHMRRTELLESEIQPLKKAHAAWVGLGKGLTILATALGVLHTLHLLKIF